VEIAEAAALKWLKPGGDLVVKVFQGEGVDAWVACLREHFVKVQLVKPKASRPGSREMYGVARQYRG
jgi:23S rRNA (uridine2552-2'-O)-methyltransferase